MRLNLIFLILFISKSQDSPCILHNNIWNLHSSTMLTTLIMNSKQISKQIFFRKLESRNSKISQENHYEDVNL